MTARLSTKQADRELLISEVAVWHFINRNGVQILACDCIGQKTVCVYVLGS